jgi:hypothetical protein
MHLSRSEPWIIEGRQRNELYSTIHPSNTSIYLYTFLFCTVHTHLCIQLVKSQNSMSAISLKVHKHKNFLGFDFEFVLFRSKLCINVKVY